MTTPRIDDASAPTLSIYDDGLVYHSGETDGTGFEAAVSGGVYDTVFYAWDDGGAGGTFHSQGDTHSLIYWTAPVVAVDTPVTLTLTLHGHWHWNDCNGRYI